MKTNSPDVSALTGQQTQLVEALKSTLLELSVLTKGEMCDHGVGICWCQTFRAMEQARAAIAKAEGRA
jgi:glycerol-3-phosphate dehydrogenase